MTKHEELTGADAQYGYRFGVDGILTIQQVMELLSCSNVTVYKLLKERKLRRGKLGRSSRVCKRSVTRYIADMEE